MQETVKTVLQYAPERRYSESFKRHVIAEIDAGRLTKESARRRYEIAGKSTVLRWYRAYSKFAQAGITLHLSMTEKQTQSHQRLKAESREKDQRIRVLEKALVNAELKNQLLDEIINLAEETYKIPVRKNSGAKQSQV